MHALYVSLRPQNMSYPKSHCYVFAAEIFHKCKNLCKDFAFLTLITRLPSTHSHKYYAVKRVIRVHISSRLTCP